ncbi:hypothetical protein [Nocardia sp. NPDC050412]|uniref:hypothetical protein n=1 Tax=Nocardia sp. NPDC050412 TaxID=3364320 RepID=UPI00379065C0
MTTPPVPILELPDPWTFAIQDRSRTILLAEICRTPDFRASVELERCVAGRLRNAYPVGSHDLEIRISDGDPQEKMDMLRVLTSAVQAADSQCRKVIFAVPTDDPSTLEYARAAGFRYVVDVDLPDIELRVLVAEPDWVTAVDMDLDHVPGT